MDEKKYKLVNGVAYHVDTPDAVIRKLEAARRNRYRIRLHYGDTETGRDWMEVYDVEGYIGRSTGRVKVPLLVHNARSMGGGHILDHCIVKITTARGKQVLYQHPKYHLPGVFSLGQTATIKDIHYPYVVMVGDRVQLRTTSCRAAQREFTNFGQLLPAALGGPA